MHPWKISVEHEHVVAHDPALDECVGSVRGEIDGHPLAPQPACDRVSQTRFVLSNQNPHICSMTEAA